MKIKLLTVFLLLSQFLLSQEKKIDSIIRIYEDKAWDAILKESDSGVFFANKIIEIAEKNKNYNKIIVGLEYRGIYKEVVLNDYETSIKDYLEAITIAEEQNNDKSKYSLYSQIGLLYLNKGDYKKGEEYYSLILENNEKGSELFTIAQVNLAIAQSRLGKYDLANENFTSYLKNEKLNFDDKLPAILGLGKNLTHQKKYAEAHKYYLKALAKDSLKGSRKFYQSYCDIIDNAIKMNNKEVVNKYIEPLHLSNIPIKSVRQKLAYYISSANAYKLLENYELASKYQDSIIKSKDSISNSRYSKTLSELETQYQTKKKEEQIVEEQNKKELWTYISILALITLIAVAILLFKNSQKRKQLKANKIELEKLLNQRNMLLRETHHRVKNSFQMVSSLLQLQAQGSEAEVAVTALDSAVERVNSMIVLHQQLYAKDNLLGVDLQTYIKDLVTEISTSYTSENITFTINIPSIVVDIDTATSLGLLVNELAINSIKYAWNNTETEKVITINLEEKENEIHFTMFDNGTSTKTKTTQQNYGSELIEIIVERLEATQKSLSENDFGLHITFNKQNG